MKTYKECCEYIGISEELPKCHVDERQIQAAYKLRVCMRAWNKQDGFEPDETASYYQKDVGYTPHFHHKDGRLLPSGNTVNGSSAGIIHAFTNAYTNASVGLRLCFITRKRAIEFGNTFIDIFNELI